jgi:hypothetical protein
MNIVFRFNGSQTLRDRLALQGVVLCPGKRRRGICAVAPEMEVLWHVLSPVTADVIARAGSHSPSAR